MPAIISQSIAGSAKSSSTRLLDAPAARPGCYSQPAGNRLDVNLTEAGKTFPAGWRSNWKELPKVFPCETSAQCLPFSYFARGAPCRLRSGCAGRARTAATAIKLDPTRPLKYWASGQLSIRISPSIAPCCRWPAISSGYRPGCAQRHRQIKWYLGAQLSLRRAWPL